MVSKRVDPFEQPDLKSAQDLLSALVSGAKKADSAFFLQRVRDAENRFQSQGSQLLRSVLGLVSETGEVCDLVKSALARGSEPNRLDLLDELGDVLFNLVRALDALELTIEDAQTASSIKLLSRKIQGKNKPAERDLQLKLFSNLDSG